MAKTKTGKTLVTVLLDRSGSMMRLKGDTIGALNGFIDDLKSGNGDIRMSLVQFDSRPDPMNRGVIRRDSMMLEKTFVAKKISKVKQLTDRDFMPRGGTPLIDAACDTIRAVAESLGDRDDVKVVIAIQTDGEENSSHKNGWNDLKALIEEKEALGWAFNFMGAGIDAYEQGGKMGLAAGKIICYGTSDVETRAAFRAMAGNTIAFSTGLMADTSYSDIQKAAAGDRS